MDIQVQELIDRIRQDGIETASGTAQTIRQEAEAEAKKILESARKEAEAITNKAKADVARMEAASNAAIEQSGRNLVLALRSRIEALFSSVISREVAAAMDAGLISKLLVELLDLWAKKGEQTPDLHLPEGTVAAVEKPLRQALSAELSKGLVIRPVKDLDAGFRLVAKDGSAWWDFSAEALGEMVAAYLNPRLADTIRSAVKDL